MVVETLEKIVGQHPLFAGLDPEFLALVTGCAKNVRFAPGQYLLREGAPADEMYLIRDGMVALEVSGPGQGRMTFQTVERNGVVGVSWLVPPYRWSFDARATTETRALAFDAECLRGKCDSDPALGYEVMKRVAPVIVERLHNARLQMLDVYAPHA